MKPELQRIRIVEASKGKIEIFEGVYYYWSGSNRYPCKDNDPLNDLNAVHEVEKLLTDDQWKSSYGWDLLGISITLKCYIAHVPAAQRVPALLDALQLQEEP